MLKYLASSETVERINFPYLEVLVTLMNDLNSCTFVC